MKPIHVVAAIIWNQDQSSLFLAKRPDDKHQGGLWEFPGGKVDEGETSEQALLRELNEEVDIQVTMAAPFSTIRHDYSDKSVVLEFWSVTEFAGTPVGKEGQQTEWVNVTNLADYDFPEANQPVVKALVALAASKALASEKAPA